MKKTSFKTDQLLLFGQNLIKFDIQKYHVRIK